MRNLYGWVIALSLLPAGVWLAQVPVTYHKPDHTAALTRTLVPVEITLKDAAGAVVVLDSHASTDAHPYQVTQLEGSFSWDVPAELDELRGILTGGSPSAAGLEPADYAISLALGRYGAVREQIKVGQEGLRVELRAPLTRKVIKVRFVDEAGDPLVAIPNFPQFNEEVVYNSARDDVLPEPVLRLPASRSDADGGRGGFSYRRARGGAAPVILLKDGWCHATVFDGGAGVLSFSLGNKDFGKDAYELSAPFDKDEYTATVTPSEAWRALDLKKRGTMNDKDPGLVDYNQPAKPEADSSAKPHVVQLKLSPTVLAWSRYAKVLDDNYVHGRIKPAQVEFPVKVDPIETLFLSSQRVTWPAEWSSYASDDFAHFARRNRTDYRSVCLCANGKGSVNGVFARVLTSEGKPARFVEASVFSLDDDKTAQAMRELEVKLAGKGKRPAACDTLSAEAQEALRTAEADEDDAALEDALGDETYALLERKEYRRRYARFGAWYDSHQRIDGDADGFLMAPHFTLEKGKSYVVYLWHTSRDDLKPDARIVIRGAGDTTDLGVVRLPQ
jgi:hypothetical protein